MRPEICSEATTYDAAYAAAPSTSPRSPRACRRSGRSSSDRAGADRDLRVRCPARPGGSDCPRRTPGRLGACPRESRRLPGRPFTSILARFCGRAFRGRSDLALVLQDLDAIQEVCPSCGASVFSAGAADRRTGTGPGLRSCARRGLPGRERPSAAGPPGSAQRVAVAREERQGQGDGPTGAGAHLVRHSSSARSGTAPFAKTAPGCRRPGGSRPAALPARSGRGGRRRRAARRHA